LCVHLEIKTRPPAAWDFHVTMQTNTRSQSAAMQKLTMLYYVCLNERCEQTSQAINNKSSISDNFTFDITVHCLAFLRT